MRSLLMPLLLVAAPASSQIVLRTPPGGSVVYAPGVAAPFNPVSDYITIGQDEPGYRNWYAATPAHAMGVKAFNAYLDQYGVGGIFPTWQLLRTATSWQKCAGQPFEVPPSSEWPHIVQTLRYVRDYVIPAVGPVEPVSAYRNPTLNACAGGAPESAHKHYSAIDMVPLRQTTREDLMRTLCRVQARRGPDYQVGLGFYAFLRFHVDTTKYRRWNMDPAVASICPPIVKQNDVATVGQPSQAAAPTTVVAAPTVSLTPTVTGAPPEPAGPKIVYAPPASSSSAPEPQPQQH